MRLAERRRWPRPAVAIHMRVRVLRGVYAGRLGTVATANGWWLTVAMGGVLAWIARTDVIQAMDDTPGYVGVIEQDHWERSTTTWPQ